MTMTADGNKPQPRPAETPGDPPDAAQLLCQSFGISDRERVERFLGNGLFDSIWLDVEDVAGEYRAAERRTIHAAQSLVRTLARVRLQSAPPRDAETLVPDLFLAHSDPHLDVVGTLYYTAEGVPLGDRVIFRGHVAHSWLSVHQVAAPGLLLEADQVVIFLLRPGADAGLELTPEAFPLPSWSLLKRTSLRVAGVVIAGGPLDWESPGRGLRVRVRAPSPDPPATPLWRLEPQEQCRRALATLLAGDGENGAGEQLAEDLLAACGGIAGLAASAPDDLPTAAIPAEKQRRVAGVLALTRRLAVASVPRRPQATDPRLVYRYLTRQLRNEPGEVAVVVMLDRYHRLVGVHRLYGAEASPRERWRRSLPGHFLARAMAARAAILLPVNLGPLVPGKGKRRELYFHEHKGRFHVDLDRPEDHGALLEETWLAAGYGGVEGPRRLRKYTLRELETFFPLGQEEPPQAPDPQLYSH